MKRPTVHVHTNHEVIVKQLWLYNNHCCNAFNFHFPHAPKMFYLLFYSDVITMLWTRNDPLACMQCLI